MNKLHRITGLIFVLGLILGLGYWQQQGWAAGQAGNGLKRLFSSAATSKAFSPALRPGSVTIPAVPMATVTVTSLGDGAANAANCPHATNCRLRDAIAKAVAGDTISFSVTGTITLTSGRLDITKDLTLDGPGVAQLTISGNSASGVFFITSGDTVEIRDLTIANGNSSTTGGGISNSGALTLTNCTLSTNRANNGGGGIYNQGSLTITGSMVSGNSSAAGSGGGIFTTAGLVNISNSTLSNNSASTGGAIANAGTTVLTGCTLYGNSAGSNGGGIFNQGTLGLTNTTLSGNDAPSGSGGGIYGNSSANSILNNCTLHNNSAANGGGIEAFSGLLQARNAIIAGNNATGLGPDIYGSLNSAGSNLIGNSSGVTIGGDPFGNILNVNPRLAPLASYGGPTQTHALLPGSPAIDEGDDCVVQSGGCLSTALITDQRGVGFARKTGSAVDIGAFESRGFTLTLASGNNQTAAVNTAFTNPLSVNVTSSFGEPTSGGQVRFTPPVSGASAGVAGNPATISNGTATTGAVTANSNGGSYNVVASATGASTAINFALANTITNTAPSFTPAAPISLQLGTSAVTALTVGTVADGQTSSGSLGVAQIVGGTATGITVMGIANTGGTITALVSSSCSATSGTVRFLVSDGSLTNTGDLQVNLTANTGPTLAYATASVMIGSATTVGPAIGPADNGSISTIAVDSAGTYTGSITVNNSTGVVSLSNAGPLGNHTITIRATDNCGVTTYAQFTVSVSATAPSYRVFSFGINSFGELSIPNEVRSGATAFAAGAYHSLVVKDGRVYAYGYNLNGQTDVPAAAQSGVTAVAAAYNHSLALKNGGVIAWGELGSGIPVEAQSGVTAMAAGDFHALFLKNGGVIGWGSNSQDQTTIPAAAQSGVTAIAAGDSHSLALKNGGVIAWGYNFEGQTSVPAAAQSGVTAIAAGERFSLAVKNGGVIGWGRNFYGELNIPVAAQSGVIAIAARAHHSLALKSTGEVIAWGQSAPTIPAVAQSGVVSIATGDFHHLVLKPTSPPAITAGTLTRQQATAGSVSTVATVIDNQTSAGNLTVAATTLPAGITVTSITNTAGTITANVAASCTAPVGPNTVVLTVTDGDGETSTANLTVNVTANTAPTLVYGSVSVNGGGSTTNSPTTATDNGSITGYAVQSSGAFTGTISVNASGLVSIGSAAPAGNHIITIRATDNCGTITDATFTLTVNATATTTTIANAASLSTTPSVVGEAYAVNVSVNAAVTPTGTVTVSDGSQSCTITLPATSCNLTSTSPSTAKTITATYHGSTNFGASSATATHRVNKAGTTTAITNAAALAAATVVGQAYTVAANVSVSLPGAGTLGGTISVSDGAASCTITLPATSCNLTSATPGTKTITATYNGDANFNTSISSGASHTVNKANTTIIITNEATLASTPTLVGQAVAINWSVTVNVPGALVAALTGNVTVSDGMQSCTAAVSAGTCSITFTTTGAKTLTAVYAGNTNFNGSTSAESTHTVNAAATTTTITNAASLSGTPTVVGQAYAVNVSVTAATGIPTGTVTVGDGSQTCTITLPATGCNLTSTSPGAPKTVTATYSGDANFSTSSATASHTVSKASTTAAITNAAALGTATVVGQAYSVSATVSVTSPGAGAPSGTITVSDGAATCTITLPATSCNLTSTTVGAKTITATYNGDANFNTSNSSGVSHSVSKANTTTAITNAGALGTASVVGQAYSVSASVSVTSPGAGTPSGTITISDGAATCTITLPATSCNLTSTTVGAKTITATYNGDVNFNGSVSPTASHAVNKASTTTTITNAATLASTPSLVGEAVAINWTVAVNSPGAVGAVLSGTVTVSDGAQSCTAAVSAGTCSITFTTAGTKTLTATYAGDANYNGDASANATHPVNATATTTTITNAASLSGTPSVVGQPYGVNVSVTAAAGTPTGTVTVSDGSQNCTVTLPATTCNLTSTTAGAKTITATYNGDANFNASSGTASHTVNKANTTTAITNSGALGTATVVGQAYAVTWSVAVNSPGAAGLALTGTVTVSDGAQSCTAAVSAGTCNLTSTTSGSPKTITATYAGDGNYNGGASSGVAHTVNKANTTTTITNATTLASTPSTVGVAVAINWSVAVNSPGALGAALTGNVTVSDGTQSCTAAVSAGTCSIPFSTTGTRTLTATYAGDVNYNGSTSANASHTVNAAATTTTITNAASLSSTPTVVGQSYAVNVSVTGPGTPTGTVTVSDGSQNCTITLPATSCNLTSTSPGAPKTITATYNGDADFSSSSTTASHTVNKASAALSSLTDSPDPSVTGQAYTVGFNINVTSPGAGTPTGTVTVNDGAGGSCTATLPATSCSLTSTTVGAKTLMFTYNGDASFSGSSNTAGHQVNKADTVTTITADTPDPSVFGANVVVNFSVVANAPGGGQPTGNVVISVSNGGETCTGTVAAGTCTLALTALGNRTLTATYAGDANYNGSASAGVPHTVNQADTTTAIVSDNPDSSAVGQNVTVVFTVTAASPGAGSPSGNVTVSDGVNSCLGTVAAGSCVVALTTPGARTLTATYAGDANFNGSSDTESHTVVAPPAIAKAFAPASTPIGGTTTLTLTITNPASNSVALTGVSFTDTFPAGLVVATPLVMNNTCGGALTNDSNGMLTAGAPGIKLSGGSAGVSPGNTCTVSVNVTPTIAGPFNNITSSVTSTNGGAGNQATATLQTNTAPTISSETVALQAGSGAASLTIATAVDPDQPVTTLGITINGNPTAASSNGVTISGVTILPSGAVTATVSTTCAATSATFTLVVTDNENATGTGTLTINVQPNQPPALTYANQTVTAGATPLFIPMTGPTDNGTIASLALQSVTPNNGGLTVSVNPATGQIAVTGATLIGSYLVTVTATDNCGATSTATLTVNVVCPAISLTPASLPGTAVNTAYSQTLSASPAGGNYSFAVTGGSLPAGLTLNANGGFSGAPTTSGTFNFRVTATGFGGCTAFQDYSLVVTCPAIALTPASLPGGSVGTAYSQTVSATPAGSYAYTVSSGALPLGLTLNASSGAITGTPTTTGSYTFMITAAAGACSDSRTWTVAIGCAAISFSPASPLPAGQAGVAYNQTISVTPSGSYTLSLISGNLPSGVILNPATGSLSGTPTTTGSFSFTIRALAGNGCEASQTWLLAITCPTVVLSSVSLPEGTLGAAYNQTITASPAGGNYTYAVAAGILPPGLNLNQATGVLNGTPAVSGTFNFRITAAGFGGCTGLRDYTVAVGGGGGCPTITLASLPNGAPAQFYSGSVAASPSGSYSYAVTSGSVPPGLTFYGSVGLLYGYPTAGGSYNFTVTATDTSNCTGSKSYSVVIGGAATASLVFGDFDGDGKADLSVWRGQAGDWLTINSKDGKLNNEAWGSSADPYHDAMVPGDYDGDGKMDLAVFRKSTGTWLIKNSRDGAITAKVWGLGTDTPVAADYDGDGKTDLAVWRGAESNWLIQRSSDGQTQTHSWGTSSAPYYDLPVPADYDGDGKTDLAVFRQQNGHWYIRLSSDGSTLDKSWGLGTDVPVAADYDGDGKADLAVWRGADTHWYVLRSSDQAVQSVSWGSSLAGDVPVAADYDGDGKADVAVWREKDGNWYVKSSRDQSLLSSVHGQSGDTPVTVRQR